MQYLFPGVGNMCVVSSPTRTIDRSLTVLYFLNKLYASTTRAVLHLSKFFFLYRAKDTGRKGNLILFTRFNFFQQPFIPLSSSLYKISVDFVQQKKIKFRGGDNMMEVVAAWRGVRETSYIILHPCCWWWCWSHTLCRQPTQNQLTCVYIYMCVYRFVRNAIFSHCL